MPYTLVSFLFWFGFFPLPTPLSQHCTYICVPRPSQAGLPCKSLFIVSKKHIIPRSFKWVGNADLDTKFLPFYNVPKRIFNYQSLFKDLKIAMIRLCKAVSSCWTVNWEQVLLLLFSSLPTLQSKKKQQGIHWCKSFFKRYYKMISLRTATYKEKVLLILIICCTCWKLIYFPFFKAILILQILR